MALNTKSSVDLSLFRQKLGLLKLSGYGTYETLEHTAIFFASSATARMKQHAPTPPDIVAVAEAGRMKSRKGRTRAEELAARIGAIAISSLGWVYPKPSGGQRRSFRKKFSTIDFNLSGMRPTVRLTNSAPGAAAVAARFPDVIQGALDDTVADIDAKARRWLRKHARDAGFTTR